MRCTCEKWACANFEMKAPAAMSEVRCGGRFVVLGLQLSLLVQAVVGEAAGAVVAACADGTDDVNG